MGRSMVFPLLSYPVFVPLWGRQAGNSRPLSNRCDNGIPGVVRGCDSPGVGFHLVSFRSVLRR